MAACCKSFASGTSSAYRAVMSWLRVGTGILLGSLLSGPAPGAALRVVTTVAPVYCLTANVAGGLATVENLLPPGASSHDFQLTFAERRKLERADLIIANGLGLESWLEKSLQQSGRTNILHAADGIGLPAIPPPDPHVWLDPSLAIQMVGNILGALQRADPANAAGYATHASVLIARLHALDRELTIGLSTITNRSIVTSHGAFVYLARRYSLTIAGVVEEQPEVDPSPAHLTALRAAIRQHDVKALFVDPHEGMRRARLLGRDFGVSVGLLDPLEAAPLTLSAYEEGMRRNLDSLRQTLK